MRLLTFILGLLVLFAPQAVTAQAEKAAQNKKLAPHVLLDKPLALPDSLPELSNLYYQKCVQEDPDPRLEEYTKIQCGCTASRLTDTMTLSEMKSFFDPLGTEDYYYTRLMMLAYTPCLEDSLGAFVYDNCLTTAASNRIPSGRRAKVCQCMSDHMSKNMPKYAINTMPGFESMKGGFNLDKALMNPFKAIITHPLFGNTMEYPARSCSMALIGND